MSKIAARIGWGNDLKPEMTRLAESRFPSLEDSYYRMRCDLRRINIPAILHMQHRRTGDHKVEVIGADTMSYRTILRTLSSIVAGDPGELRLMRIDLSADIADIPIDWFRTHVRVPGRRTHEIFGKQSKDDGKRTSGLYYGGKHDLIRIYDKRQELAYRRAPLDFPFAAWAGPSAPRVVTRVERQLRGEKIPPAFRGIQSLACIAEFNPFEQVHFEMSREIPFGGTRTTRTVLASRGLQRLVDREGPQAARSILNKDSGGKASRLIRSLGRPETFRGPNLYEIYRVEMLAQLEAA